MNDPEFIELRNRFFFGIGIALLFTIPLFFFFKNKLVITDSEILTDIKQDKNMILWVREENCKNCKELQNQMKKDQIHYHILSINKDIEYETILRELEISKEDIISPTIIVIEEGKVVSTLVNIKTKEEIKNFINNYNLTDEEG